MVKKQPRKAPVVPPASPQYTEEDNVTPANAIGLDDEQAGLAHTKRAKTETAEVKNDTSFVTTNERSNERANARTKNRHTFDIFADQLLALREIAIEREKLFGERTLLGDLAQEALDMFIAKERNKS